MVIQQESTRIVEQQSTVLLPFNNKKKETACFIFLFLIMKNGLVGLIVRCVLKWARNFKIDTDLDVRQIGIILSLSSINHLSTRIIRDRFQSISTRLYTHKCRVFERSYL